MLASVIPHIDQLVIADTGSVDDTPRILAEILKASGKPGLIIGIDRADFDRDGYGPARTTVFQQARGRCDFDLVVDADDTFHVERPDWKALLVDDDHFEMPIEGLDGYAFPQQRVFRDSCGWRYERAVHNFPTADAIGTMGDLEGAIRIIHHADGHSHQDREAKFLRNVLWFEARLREIPNDPRSLFYLGETWRDLDEPEKAVEYFARRLTASGQKDQVFWSLFQIGVLSGSWAHMLEAHEHSPNRPEPLLELARMCRRDGMRLAGLRYIQRAAALPPCRDMFADLNIRWQLLEELAIISHLCGDDVAARRALDEALTLRVPPAERPRLEQTHGWLCTALGAKAA